MSNGDQLELVGWTLLALTLGAAIGFERELRGHEAGIRTSALVCAAAALFGGISHLYGDDRVAAGVVQGIGFLGAGLLFQRRHSVGGVTTAATIWLEAAIGLAIGVHLWLVGLFLALATVVVLELVPISEWVYRFGHEHGLHGSSKRGPSSANPTAVED